MCVCQVSVYYFPPFPNSLILWLLWCGYIPNPHAAGRSWSSFNMNGRWIERHTMSIFSSLCGLGGNGRFMITNQFFSTLSIGFYFVFFCATFCYFPIYLCSLSLHSALSVRGGFSRIFSPCMFVFTSLTAVWLSTSVWIEGKKDYLN